MNFPACFEISLYSVLGLRPAQIHPFHQELRDPPLRRCQTGSNVGVADREAVLAGIEAGDS